MHVPLAHSGDPDGKENKGDADLAAARRQGQPGTTCRTGPRPTWREHHGVLQGLQRANQAGQIIPAQITIFEDRSFTFVLKTPPAADLLRKAAGIEKGSDNPRITKVGTVSLADVRKIAETKMPDLNANTIDEAALIVKGTARSMGIEVE